MRRSFIGDRTGYVSVVNLLGPRSAAQRPVEKFWNAAFTITQFRLEFVASDAVRTPVVLGRTFLTFCAPE